MTIHAMPSYTRHTAATALLLAATSILSACQTTPTAHVEATSAPTTITTKAPQPPLQAVDGEWPEWFQTACTPIHQLDQLPKVRRQGHKPVIHQNWLPGPARVQVELHIQVTAQGTLGQVAYRPADTDPRIIQAIERSLRDWRFAPNTSNGQPVSHCFAQPYEFVFKGSK